MSNVERGKVPGYLRPCVKVNWTAKKRYGREEEARAALLKDGGHNGSDPYKCPICKGWHNGKSNRRMIVASVNDPCSTPGCERTDTHPAKWCGTTEGVAS